MSPRLVRLRAVAQKIIGRTRCVVLYMSYT